LAVAAPWLLLLLDLYAHAPSTAAAGDRQLAELVSKTIYCCCNTFVTVAAAKAVVQAYSLNNITAASHLFKELIKLSDFDALPRLNKL
jgi:hypothetical protein